MSDQLEQQREQPPEQPESRENELTRKVTKWVEGPLVTVLTLILLYYGGRQGGDSHFINHALWQDAILWPVVVIGFVLLVIDRSGHVSRPPKAERKALLAAAPKNKRHSMRMEWGQPARRVSRAIARRIIARQERKGIQT